MTTRRNRLLLGGVLLAILAFAPYFQTMWFDFVVYDDDGYVTGNVMGYLKFTNSGTVIWIMGCTNANP